MEFLIAGAVNGVAWGYAAAKLKLNREDMLPLCLLSYLIIAGVIWLVK